MVGRLCNWRCVDPGRRRQYRDAACTVVADNVHSASVRSVPVLLLAWAGALAGIGTARTRWTVDIVAITRNSRSVREHTA
jgi:hypothetical protein